MKLLFLFLLLIPARFYPLSVFQIQSDIRSYFTRFKSYETGFILKTSGKLGGGFFKGSFAFQNGEIVYKMEKTSARKKDGGALLRDSKEINGVFQSLESLYNVMMTNDFSFRIISEDAGSVSIAVIDSSDKNRFTINYNKTVRMADSIIYSGDKSIPAINVKIEYDTIQGLPVFSQITALLPSSKITLFLDDTKFELNP